MGENPFVERVRSYFGYLVEDYGFSVAERRYDEKAFGNSLVRFRSAATDVTVVLDRGQVFVYLAPRPESSGHRLNMRDVVDYLAPEPHEPVYVFPEEWNDYWSMVDSQVRRLARVLERYCTPVLAGEFSKWEEIVEIIQKESLDKYRRLTGKAPLTTDSGEIQRDVQEEMRRRRDQ